MMEGKRGGSILQSAEGLVSTEDQGTGGMNQKDVKVLLKKDLLLIP